jgi:hypothetical protein
MTLDERLRAELRGSVEPWPLREDDALDAVRSRHRRGLVRRRVTRQAVAAAVVVSLFASVAVVISWRNAPDNAGVAAISDGYRSAATIRLAPAPSAGSTSTTIGPAFKPQELLALALAATTQRAALLGAQLSPATNVEFRAALNSVQDLLTITVTAETQYVSEAVTHAWAAAFTEALRAERIRRMQAADRTLNRKVRALHDQLRQIDSELILINPAYKPYTTRDIGWHGHPNLSDMNPPPHHAPEQGSTRELNLANERIQLLSRLADLGAEAARTQISLSGPDTFGAVTQKPVVRVHLSSRKHKSPVLFGWAISLFVVLGGALFVYRRRGRSLRQVAA